MTGTPFCILNSIQDLMIQQLEMEALAKEPERY